MKNRWKMLVSFILSVCLMVMASCADNVQKLTITVDATFEAEGSSSVKLPSASATAGAITLALTKKPDGATASIDGGNLITDSAGNYKITYTAKTETQTASADCLVTIKDTKKPELAKKTDFIWSGKGSRTIPKITDIATVTEFSKWTDTVTVKFLEIDALQPIDVQAGEDNSIEVTAEGKYLLNYTVKDAVNLESVFDYEIPVSFNIADFEQGNMSHLTTLPEGNADITITENAEYLTDSAAEISINGTEGGAKKYYGAAIGTLDIAQLQNYAGLQFKVYNPAEQPLNLLILVKTADGKIKELQYAIPGGGEGYAVEITKEQFSFNSYTFDLSASLAKIEILTTGIETGIKTFYIDEIKMVDNLSDTGVAAAKKQSLSFEQEWMAGTQDNTSANFGLDGYLTRRSVDTSTCISSSIEQASEGVKSIKIEQTQDWGGVTLRPYEDPLWSQFDLKNDDVIAFDYYSSGKSLDALFVNINDDTSESGQAILKFSVQADKWNTIIITKQMLTSRIADFNFENLRRIDINMSVTEGTYIYYLDNFRTLKTVEKEYLVEDFEGETIDATCSGGNAFTFSLDSADSMEGGKSLKAEMIYTQGGYIGVNLGLSTLNAINAYNTDKFISVTFGMKYMPKTGESLPDNKFITVIFFGGWDSPSGDKWFEAPANEWFDLTVEKSQYFIGGNNQNFVCFALNRDNNLAAMIGTIYIDNIRVKVIEFA